MDKDVLQKQLRHLSSRWVKNKEAIGFSCEIDIKEDNKVSYSVKNCPDKYKKPLSELLDSILKESTFYIVSEFSYKVKEVDAKKVSSYIDKKVPVFMSMLLDGDCDSFFMEIKKASKIVEFSLIASSIKDDNGVWKNWKGDSLNPLNGYWVSEDGSMYSDPTSVALWSIISKISTKTKKQKKVI